MPYPFSSTPSNAGGGTIHLALLPPDTPRLKTLSYQYPLKLISPSPVRTEQPPNHLVHTVYLLTYGGGLVAGDTVDFNVAIEETTRLALLTQGSTKLFKTPSKDVTSKQKMTVSLAPGSALCYLPDPVQPFEKSSFEQQQIYEVDRSPSEGNDTASLCALDWVSNGRAANGENWSFYRYGSKNEIFLRNADHTRKLLLRDNMLLQGDDNESKIASRMDGLAVYGTLMLYGPLFEHLSQFFLDEFQALPRIGGRKWDSASDSGEELEPDETMMRRTERQRQENTDGFLWSAASVRNCTVVKFGAKEVEHGRKWLRNMLLEEGTVAEEFGERALLCLR